MSAPSEPRQLPVILIVDSDVADLDASRKAISRRFGADYDVRTAGTAQEALDTLRKLCGAGVPVPLVAADADLTDIDGVAFLEMVHGIDKRATRVLTLAMDEHHTKVPLKRLHLVQRATALGRIDAAWVKGWDTPEDWLYPQLQDTLTAWTRANRPGHVVYRIVGEQWAPRSHEVRELLARNGVPFEFHAAETSAGRQLIHQHSIDTTRLPAVIHHEGRVLHDPSEEEVAAAHGISTRPRHTEYDLVVVGAGPAGLAAAVFAASEGLRTLVLEPHAIGGQAGTSSMIRNYLGFVRGISGGELAHRAWEQAVLLGAEFAFTRPVAALCEDGESWLTLRTSEGVTVRSRAVVLATGVSWRRLELPVLEQLQGSGVFYGAAGVEAAALAGQPVAVIGGANSAGQAVLHLARYASVVHLLVRGATLTAGMSQYLIDQIEATDNIEVHLRTRVVDAETAAGLERLIVENVDSRVSTDVPARALFVLIGAEPHTEWLAGLARDEHGFVLTDRDVPHGTGHHRQLLPFETSMPGVFAVGDVRHGSVKRVAGAVGEGSVAVGSVHQYLRMVPTDDRSQADRPE